MARWGRMVALVAAGALHLLLLGAGAATAVPICPPPLSLHLAAGGGATRAGKSLLIRVILRSSDKASALADVSLKIALPAGLCPLKTATAPKLRPQQRAVVEGTAGGGVNVYWASFGFKAGQRRTFYVKATVARNLTAPTTLPVEALAWVGSDGQCSVAAQPVGVSQLMGDTSMQWCWAMDPQ